MARKCNGNSYSKLFSFSRILQKTLSLIFQVSVTDNGHPPLSSTTRVVVNVADINDHPPVFLQRLFRIKIPERSASGTETRLCRVIASDLDAGLNAQIEYDILLGKNGGRFRIDADTGFIYSNHEFKDGEEYELSVSCVSI